MRQHIRVVLADDHAVVRTGVRLLLEDEPDITVIGEAGDGHTAVDLALALHPDVLIMDVHMPSLNGIEATRRICTDLPDVRVLGFSADDEAPYVAALLAAGACGYLLKTADGNTLVRAIRMALAGKIALEPALLQAVHSYTTQLGPRLNVVLSARECEVLQLAAIGLTNKQISAQLMISDRTVQGYLQTAYTKLDVRSRTQAVTVALQHGLLSLEPGQPDSATNIHHR